MPNTHKREMERMYKQVAPLVDKMRAKYDPSLNIDGFEPALTNDIAEIALEVEKEVWKKAGEIVNGAFSVYPSGGIHDFGDEEELISKTRLLSLFPFQIINDKK
jgi:hypothetical protein